MSASSCLPRSRFQPGIASRYNCTGASPSAFAICGLPPESSTSFLPVRAEGFTSAERDLLFAAAFVERFGLFGNFCECESAKIKRADPALTILNECDHFTVTSGQHHHANAVLLSVSLATVLMCPILTASALSWATISIEPCKSFVYLPTAFKAKPGCLTNHSIPYP